MSSGDFRIDALLASNQYSLAQQLKHGMAVTITYSFMEHTPNAAAGYETYAWLPVRDFRPLSNEQRTAIDTLLGQFSAVAGVTFQRVENDGLIRYGSYSGREGIPEHIENDGESLLRLYDSLPGTDIWLNHQSAKIGSLDSDFGRFLILHETAHALGLKHPGAYSEFDSGPYLPSDLDHSGNTILSYNGGIRDDLGAFDILALQYLYGASGGVSSANSIVIGADDVSSLHRGSFFDDKISISPGSFGTQLYINALTGNDSIELDLANFDNGAFLNINGGPGHDILRLDTQRSELSFKSDDYVPHTLLMHYSQGERIITLQLENVERIQLGDRSLALDVDAGPGEVFRLYQAAFKRTPDPDGLGYWIALKDAGMSLQEISSAFIASREFAERYGVDANDEAFIDTLYMNVLGRPADAEGQAYWLNELQTGAHNRADVLVGFSESQENHTKLLDIIGKAIEYTEFSL